MDELYVKAPIATYPDFKKEILSELGSAFGVPYAIVAGTSSGYTYASAKLDHQTYFRSIWPEGKEYVITGYTETDHDIPANFKLVPLSTPPRTFSKLRLINALMSRNLWPAVRDWLDTSGYYDIFLARGLAAGYAVASRPSLALLGAFPKTSARIIRNSPPD